MAGQQQTSTTLVKQGTCKDCGNDILMDEKEKKFWDEMVAKKNYTFPKRCADCRKVKRQATTVPSVLKDVANDARKMSEKAINDEYQDHGDILSQELMDLATRLDLLALPSAEG